MGLDITAVNRLKLIENYTEGTDGFYVGHTDACFLSRTDGLQRGTYEYGESMGFCAGSYGGYNTWREQLAILAGCYEPTLHESGYDTKGRMLYSAGAWAATGGAFWELINFSDCEGVIGPKTSAKLAKDFADFQSKADQHPDEYFRRKYSEWRQAFELASDDGAVSFH